MASSKLASKGKNYDFLKRQVQELQDLVKNMKLDFNDMLTHLHSTCKPACNEARAKVEKLFNDLDDAIVNANVLNVIGNCFEGVGALSGVLGCLTFFTTGPVGAALVIGGAYGLAGLGVKHQAIKCRYSSEKKLLESLDQELKPYCESMELLKDKYQKVSSHYERIFKIVEDLQDLEGFEDFTQESLGQLAFGKMEGLFNDTENFDYRSYFKQAKTTGYTKTQDTFIDKVYAVVVKVSFFIWSTIKKICSIISNAASIIGINLADDFIILKGAWTGFNFLKDSLKAFTKTLTINPVFRLMEYGVSGVNSFYELSKFLIQGDENTPCANATLSLIKHLKKEEDVLNQLDTELPVVLGEYENISEFLEFVNGILD